MKYVESESLFFSSSKNCEAVWNGADVIRGEFVDIMVMEPVSNFHKKSIDI